MPQASQNPLRHVRHAADICVIGGGMTGLCAALAAARHGARVILMHDRPVLGGNASSEMRVPICGADRHGTLANLRETGILEELRLDNLACNPHANYSVWDLVLYDKARREPNLGLMLNCSCQEATLEANRLRAISGWQSTTQTRHTVSAGIFIDCSGDAILAPLTGAAFRMGREGRNEFDESIAPPEADAHTMGLTCYFMARHYDTPQPFAPPSWIRRFERDADLPYGAAGHRFWEQGYWWVELGGNADTIHDAETLRDQLVAAALGVWDHIKNRGNHGAENWALDWLQFLPGKRESRRYIGDHVLRQGDIDDGGRFEDIVAYGGWSMDDHHSAGLDAVKLGCPATIFHPAPSPYGIPYRCLYSRNIENLMCAGRAASCTHVAMSSTRVMGTCSVMGQAAGTAAELCVRRAVQPRALGAAIRDLQQELLEDDCYLPGLRQTFAPLCADAQLTASQGDPEPVRDGISRPLGDAAHAWTGRPGDSLTYRFRTPARIASVTLALDSALEKIITICRDNGGGRLPLAAPPPNMPRSFRIEGLLDNNWKMLAQIGNNHQRLVRVPIAEHVAGLRFILDATWAPDVETKVYRFTVS